MKQTSPALRADGWCYCLRSVSYRSVFKYPVDIRCIGILEERSSSVYTENLTVGQYVAAETGAPKPQPQSPGWMQLLPFVIIFALFYFMMIRPQQRKEKERRRMIEELRAGAKIVFAGGIVGTIAEATEKTFVVETTDGKMEILRSCVQGVLGAEAAK